MISWVIELLHLLAAEFNKYTHRFEIIKTKAKACSKDRFTQTLIRSRQIACKAPNAWTTHWLSYFKVILWQSNRKYNIFNIDEPRCMDYYKKKKTCCIKLYILTDVPATAFSATAVVIMEEKWLLGVSFMLGCIQEFRLVIILTICCRFYWRFLF